MAKTKTDIKKRNSSKKKKSLIKRLFKTESTRDAIFFFTALFVILPAGLIFLYISFNIYRERKEFANKHNVNL